MQDHAIQSITHCGAYLTGHLRVTGTHIELPSIPGAISRQAMQEQRVQSANVQDSLQKSPLRVIEVEGVIHSLRPWVSAELNNTHHLSMRGLQVNLKVQTSMYSICFNPLAR